MVEPYVALVRVARERLRSSAVRRLPPGWVPSLRPAAIRGVVRRADSPQSSWQRRSWVGRIQRGRHWLRQGRRVRSTGTENGDCYARKLAIAVCRKMRRARYQSSIDFIFVEYLLFPECGRPFTIKKTGTICGVASAGRGGRARSRVPAGVSGASDTNDQPANRSTSRRPAGERTASPLLPCPDIAPPWLRPP